MRRFIVALSLTCLMTTVVGRWYAYRMLLAERRVEQAAQGTIEEALSRKVRTDDFAVEDVRLAEVLAKVAEQSPVPMRINRQEVEKTWLVMDRKIDIQPGLFTLEDLLDQISGQCDLGWCRWDDFLVVTSWAQADRRNAPFTRVYRLPADLPDGTPLLSDDGDEFAALISTTIEPDMWDDVGGPGVLRDAQGAVVVHQSRQIQRQVEAMLANFEHLAERGEKSFSLPPWPAEDELPVWAALDRIDSVDFVDVPLNQVARILSQRHDITIVLATATLADAAITPATPVTMKLDNVSLRTILREILAELKLTYYIRGGGVIQITTPEDAEAQLSHWVHDVGDLLDQRDRHALRRLEPLIDLITATVEADSWDEVGGPGCISPFGRQWLIVSQTQDIHEQVEQLLDSIRAVLSPAGVRQTWLTPLEPMAVAVQRALDLPVRLSYDEVPLNEVCRRLSDEIGVPIVLKRSSLADAAIGEDAPITIDLPPLPLHQGLKLMLDQWKLAFHVQGEVIYVTIPEDAERSLDTRILDVRHLTSPGAGGIDERTLARAIRTSTGTDWWDDRGGPATLSYYRGLLVVSHIGEKQREIEHFVNALSEGVQNRRVEATTTPVWIGPEAEILARLQERDSFKFTGGDLDAAVTRLFAAHSIPVHLRRSLNAAIRKEPAPRLEFHDLPLIDILDGILDFRAIDFFIENGVVCVTDPRVDPAPLFSRLYPVGPHWPGETKLDGRELAKRLMESVAIESWDGAGGRGLALPLNGRWLLVVQTLEVHRQVEEAIARLTAGKAKQSP